MKESTTPIAIAQPPSRQQRAWEQYYASVQPHGASQSHAFRAGYDAGRLSVLGDLSEPVNEHAEVSRG